MYTLKDDILGKDIEASSTKQSFNQEKYENVSIKHVSYVIY